MFLVHHVNFILNLVMSEVYQRFKSDATRLDLSVSDSLRYENLVTSCIKEFILMLLFICCISELQGNLSNFF